MKINQIIVETSTTSGVMATVAKPIGGVLTRPEVSGLKPISQLGGKKKGPYANSLSEGAVKQYTMDLKELTDEEFKKKYKKTKQEARKAMKEKPSQVDEARLEEDDVILVPGQGRIRKSGFVKHDPDRAEHEGQTLKNSLHTIIRVAQQLDKELSTKDNFPEWVSEKVGSVKSMMVAVADYLQSAKEMSHDGDAMEGLGAGVIAGGPQYEDTDALNNARQRVQSQGFTDSPEERNADRLERRRRHNEKLDKLHTDYMNREPVGGGVVHHDFSGSGASQARSDRLRDAEVQHKIDVLAHRRQRMQRDDDDSERTFDMMRDRINRFQSGTQRDVDPEQLAAISNIKYEPRKKVSDVEEDIQSQRSVDAKGRTQQQWIQAVKKKFPDAKIMQSKMVDGHLIASLPDGRTITWTKAEQPVAEGAKVDRMVKHVAQSEKKLGHTKKEAENIAWATANKRGMLDNKNKKAK